MSMSYITVSPHGRVAADTKRFRIVVTTPIGAVYEHIHDRPSWMPDLTVFAARTIWKNERRLFRRLAEVK